MPLEALSFGSQRVLAHLAKSTREGMGPRPWNPRRHNSGLAPWPAGPTCRGRSWPPRDVVGARVVQRKDCIPRASDLNGWYVSYFHFFRLLLVCSMYTHHHHPIHLSHQPHPYP